MLTGKEDWVQYGKQGYEVHGLLNGAYWPIVEVELDCELCKIDVCGLLQVVNLLDFMAIKIYSDEGEIVIEDFLE